MDQAVKHKKISTCSDKWGASTIFLLKLGHYCLLHPCPTTRGEIEFQLNTSISNEEEMWGNVVQSNSNSGLCTTIQIQSPPLKETQTQMTTLWPLGECIDAVRQYKPYSASLQRYD